MTDENPQGPQDDQNKVEKYQTKDDDFLNSLISWADGAEKNIYTEDSSKTKSETSEPDSYAKSAIDLDEMSDGIDRLQKESETSEAKGREYDIMLATSGEFINYAGEKIDLLKYAKSDTVRQELSTGPAGKTKEKTVRNISEAILDQIILDVSDIRLQSLGSIEGKRIRMENFDTYEELFENWGYSELSRVATAARLGGYRLSEVEENHVTEALLQLKEIHRYTISAAEEP